MHVQNQNLLAALHACLASCEHCATACLGEQSVQMLTLCIQLDRDCADICALTARVLARGSNYARHLLATCADVCMACGDECEKHAAHMPHCKECAESCRRCEEACRMGMSMAA